MMNTIHNKKPTLNVFDGSKKSSENEVILTDYPLADYLGDEELKMVENSKVNVHIYNHIKHFLGKRILEIGSGIGNISKYIIKGSKNNELIVLSDISDKYLTRLEKKFHGNNTKVMKYDLEDIKIQKLKELKIDTIICLNVLEHIKNDEKALRNLYNILNKNGKLILLVPYLPILYGKLDKKLGHFRRYSKKLLLKKIIKIGFSIKKTFFINFIAIFGWFLKSKILKRNLQSKDIVIYDSLMPIFTMVDRITKPFMGQSLICICTKK